MSMTKKDYVAVADAMNEVLWTPQTDPGTVALAVVRLADSFQGDNPRFDRSRFMQACLRDNS
jgi:hypothetical protein